MVDDEFFRIQTTFCKAIVECVFKYHKINFFFSNIVTSFILFADWFLWTTITDYGPLDNLASGHSRSCTSLNVQSIGK